MEMQTCAPVLILLRLKFLLPEIVGLCLAYGSIIVPGVSDSN